MKVDQSNAGENMAACAHIFWSIPLCGLLLAGAAGAGPAEEIGKGLRALERLEDIEANGRERGKLLQRIGDAERARGKSAAARRAYRRALDAYARANASEERDRLLDRLYRKGKGWPKKLAAGFLELRDAWKLVGELQARAAKLPRRDRPAQIDEIEAELYELMQQAGEIGQIARRHRDAALQAAALQAQGRVMGATGDLSAEAEKYQAAAELCARACPGRSRALRAETAALLEFRGELDKAYRLFARINAENVASLPEERRRYARSADLVRVCAKLRAAERARSCADLERNVVGFATFRDFSAGPTQPRLTEEELREVHAEYLPLLSSCLAAAVRRGEAEHGETFELDWAVRNDGRTDRFKCQPPAEGLELLDCLRQELETFRYPRYRGERRTVTVPLAVGRP